MAAVCFIDLVVPLEGIYVGWFIISLAGLYHVDVFVTSYWLRLPIVVVAQHQS